MDLIWAIGLEGLKAAGLPQAVNLAARGPLAAHAGCLAHLVGLEVAQDPNEHLFRQHLLYQGQLPLQLAQARAAGPRACGLVEHRDAQQGS